MSGARYAAARRLEQARTVQHQVSLLKDSVAQHNSLKAAASWEDKASRRAELAAAARLEAAAAEEARMAELARAAAAREAAARAQAEREAAEVAARLTPAQRRAQLAAQARELAARREAERQAEAEVRHAQQFNSSCDELRTLQVGAGRKSSRQAALRRHLLVCLLHANLVIVPPALLPPPIAEPARHGHGRGPVGFPARPEGGCPGGAGGS